MNVLGPEHNFLGIQDHYSWNEAEVAVLPVPLEATTSYLTGTVSGAEALIKASQQVELYDEELQTEIYLQGIATLPPLDFSGCDHQRALDLVADRTAQILNAQKKPLLIGGEHSLSIGAVRAFSNLHSDLHVLHLDAHADLRDSYQNSSDNHACVMARIREMCSFTSIGIRSLSGEEAETIRKGLLNVWDIHQIRRTQDWINQVIESIKGPVYLTLDLDVFDPAVIPNVGTPEPGGLGWQELLVFLRQIFQTQPVVGLDMVELCPSAGPNYGVFNAAKLAYRLIGYWLQKNKNQD
jgi:agmatinase